MCSADWRDYAELLQFVTLFDCGIGLGLVKSCTLKETALVEAYACICWTPLYTVI